MASIYSVRGKPIELRYIAYIEDRYFEEEGVIYRNKIRFEKHKNPYLRLYKHYEKKLKKGIV